MPGWSGIKESYRGLIDQYIKILETLQQEIKKGARGIERLAKEDPRVEPILPVRGIGEYSAMLILAEIGDIDRFQHSQKAVFLCWALSSHLPVHKRFLSCRLTK